MNRPNFICGAYNVTIEHQNDWDVTPRSGISENESLGGTNLRDVSYFKYAYRLIYDAMSLEDFEALEQLINYHNTSGDPILFNYEKFWQTDGGVYVHGKLIPRSFRGGKGKDSYYQTSTIELVERDPRS